MRPSKFRCGFPVVSAVWVLGVVPIQGAGNLSLDASWQAAIARKPEKTVEDYYLLLPTSFLACEGDDSEYSDPDTRRKQIRVLDRKNGYISLVSGYEIAVFRNRKAKVDIVAVQARLSGASNTCGAINDILQFVPRPAGWKDRRDLLPAGYTHGELYEKYSESDLFPYFALPRKGLEIRVKADYKDTTLAVLKWDGSRFQASR